MFVAYVGMSQIYAVTTIGYNLVFPHQAHIHYNYIRLYFNAPVVHIYISQAIITSLNGSKCFFFLNEIIYSCKKSTNDRSDRVLQAPCVCTGDILYMFLECEQFVC